jgi:hypothetical protein
MNNVIQEDVWYTKRIDLKFDGKRLAKDALEIFDRWSLKTPMDLFEFAQLTAKHKNASLIDQYRHRNVVCLKKRVGDSPEEALMDLSGSGLPVTKRDESHGEDKYIEYNPLFDGYYIMECVKEIERFVREKYNVVVGKARLLRLEKRTCYPLHKDYNQMRVHVPIITNEGCFFVMKGKVEGMSEVGRAYLFNNNVRHTAVNASQDDRIHLVINCEGTI